jgi:hypothetical protein
LLTASIIRAITLMIEAVSTSETFVNYSKLHGATSQKTVIFVAAFIEWKRKEISFIFL